ncbi:DUF3311 domain-containing protein [Sporomusa acidovorans]|uniref:DUF3311 domain-containing protein n=1 Tax=Sporomusa acidovorans (strain ATCC 49682 / DSM 3132 / Mol) TaxID=1123286 RepID=A0ABZ3J3G9_SPOA4|nr:DUF3311 domain-containing protein [Sporomusa acidovorans]OZC19943.1 hypothetical protein SPACI_23400 [Sporomusa acidovorans DSM 3132]SDD49344.1 Protein of unknown function [Sporomusa acidovorans]
MDALKVILTLIPFVWIVGMVPFVNTVHPMVLGLPFLAFWLLSGIFVAFGCLTVLYKLDSRKDNEA